MKLPLFATMNNINYLPNVLSKMEAEEKGAYASIWVDDEGYIAEGAKRLLELAPKLIEQGRLKSVKTCNLSVEEAKGATEMMYVGSTLPLLPIVMWHEQPIGDGKIGELTMALSSLIWDDMVAGHTQRIPVSHVN